jgi:hypothetical protein
MKLYEFKNQVAGCSCRIPNTRMFIELYELQYKNVYGSV